MSLTRVHVTRVHGAGFLCRFTGAIDEMKRKDQGNRLKVLAVIERDPLVSVFEATANVTIARTLDALERDGYTERREPQPPYPWNRVTVTEKGLALLHSEARAR